MNSNPKRRAHRWLAIALLITLPSVTLALQADKDQPIDVEADGVDMNDRDGVSIYQGNVVLTQGSIVLKADKVTVTQSSNGADRLVAEGNPVTFRQETEDNKGTIQGRANRTEYDANSEVIQMIGNAMLIQGSDTFKSDRITYDRVNAVIKAGASAQGKQRVKVTIGGRKDK